MKTISTLTTSAIALAVLAGPSFAGDYCPTCYRKEISPPVYRTVQETVQIAPARVIAHRTPAEIGMVRETVQVAPARQGWRRSIDAYGNEIMCLETTPAQYTSVARPVVVRPASVAYEQIPAQYGTVQRTQMVAPASARWVPTAAPSYGYAHQPVAMASACGLASASVLATVTDQR